jgi:energy-coupling factor transport system ATP-binding protein
VDHNIEKMAEYTTKLMVFFEGEMKLYGPTSEILQQKELLNDYHIRLPQVTDAAYGLKEQYQFTKLPINLKEASQTFKANRGQENGSHYSNQESCP